MELHRLSFCKAIKLADDMAEFVVDEGVEFNLDRVDEYHFWITGHLRSPYFLLIHKLHAYTYDFASQRKLGTLPGIQAAAFVVYSNVSELATEVMLSMPRESEWIYRIFDNRDDAVAWLEYQRESASPSIKAM